MSEGTVFIVDDDADLLATMVDLVEGAGLQAEGFSSARAFLDAGKKSGDGCLVVDIHMPGMDGLQLQQKLKDDRVAIPVIVMTGRGDVPKAVQALKAGAVDFIEKPFSGEFVLGSIHRALELGRNILEKETFADGVRHNLLRLTGREREVLDRLVIGDSNKMIAAHLDISPRTVEVHRARVMEKMQARSLSQLVRMALAILDDQTA
jgi:two-component system response regulator FixJ